ncbi:hypothetical protein HDU67_000356 [Dinochytrium kinnereticum]|nr:hypothetical protein HDU67_000356 [Dinochytrium kinnereticum]
MSKASSPAASRSSRSWFGGTNNGSQRRFSFRRNTHNIASRRKVDPSSDIGAGETAASERGTTHSSSSQLKPPTLKGQGNNDSRGGSVPATGSSSNFSATSETAQQHHDLPRGAYPSPQNNLTESDENFITPRAISESEAICKSDDGASVLTKDSDEVCTLAAFGIESHPSPATNLATAEELGSRTDQETITSLLGAGNPEQWGRRRMSLPTEILHPLIHPSQSRRASVNVDPGVDDFTPVQPVTREDGYQRPPTLRRRSSIDSTRSAYSISNPPKGILKASRRPSISSTFQNSSSARLTKPTIACSADVMLSDQRAPRNSISGRPIDVSGSNPDAIIASSASINNRLVSSGASLGHAMSRSYSSNATGNSTEPVHGQVDTVEEESADDLDAFERWLLQRSQMLYARPGEELETLLGPDLVYFLSTGVIDVLSSDSNLMFSRAYGPTLLDLESFGGRHGSIRFRAAGLSSYFVISQSDLKDGEAMFPNLRNLMATLTATKSEEADSIGILIRNPRKRMKSVKIAVPESEMQMVHEESEDGVSSISRASVH